MHVPTLRPCAHGARADPVALRQHNRFTQPQPRGMPQDGREQKHAR